MNTGRSGRIQTLRTALAEERRQYRREIAARVLPVVGKYALVLAGVASLIGGARFYNGHRLIRDDGARRIEQNYANSAMRMSATQFFNVIYGNGNSTANLSALEGLPGVVTDDYQHNGHKLYDQYSRTHFVIQGANIVYEGQQDVTKKGTKYVVGSRSIYKVEDPANPGHFVDIYGDPGDKPLSESQLQAMAAAGLNLSFNTYPYLDANGEQPDASDGTRAVFYELHFSATPPAPQDLELPAIPGVGQW